MTLLALDLITDFDFPDGAAVRRALARRAAAIRRLLDAAHATRACTRSVAAFPHAKAARVRAVGTVPLRLPIYLQQLGKPADGAAAGEDR